MPRQSVAALSVVAPTVQRRPKPPRGMPKAQRELWQLIVNRLPADTFQDEHLAQLAGYVQHVCLAEKLGKELDRFDPAQLVTAEGRIYFEQLAVALDREHKQVLAFGRALRITISSTYDPITMARKRRAGPHSFERWKAVS